MYMQKYGLIGGKEGFSGIRGVQLYWIFAHMRKY